MADNLTLLLHQWHVEKLIEFSLWYALIFFLLVAVLFLSFRPKLRSDIASTWLMLAVFLILAHAVWQVEVREAPHVLRWLLWLHLDCAITYFLYAIASDRWPETRQWEWWHTTGDTEQFSVTTPQEDREADRKYAEDT